MCSLKAGFLFAALKSFPVLPEVCDIVALHYLGTVRIFYSLTNCIWGWRAPAHLAKLFRNVVRRIQLNLHSVSERDLRPSAYLHRWLLVACQNFLASGQALLLSGELSPLKTRD